LDEHLIILGASARAAAGSALRAGLRPWCVDLFADADLVAMCPARRLQGTYPGAFVEAVAEAPPGPWMYTGGLEHHPRLVDRMAKLRPLWGNDGDVLRRARDPAGLAKAAREAGLPAPGLGGSGRGRWLVKPRASAGGIRFWGGERVAETCYLQEWIDGESSSVVFAGRAVIGMTRQLVGEAWLGAPPFRYCGSVGPVEVEKRIQTLGNILVERMGLRGVYGVDGILRDGEFWPVELNPRYTASVEVLERATGVQSLPLHARSFGPISDASEKRSSSGTLLRSVANQGVVAKGILYARADVTFPADGPWPSDDYADLPHPGEVIEAGRPILTLFAPDLDALRQRAAEVEALLYAGR
jgi:uncharacterized protein